MTNVPAPPAYGSVAQPPSTGRRNPVPWVLVAVLAIVAITLGVLLAVGNDDTSGDGTSGDGTGAGDPSASDAPAFATPEEAIEFSTQHLADGDGAAALTAWARDAQAENIDFSGALERVGVFGPNDTTSLPSDDELFVGLAKAARAGDAAQQYRRLVLSLLLPDIDLNTVTVLDDDVSAQDIADALDSTRLTGLRADQIDRVEGPEQYVETLDEMAVLVGADERREYVVLYEWEGETYLGGVGVLRYGEEWQIDALSAVLASTAVGTLEPMSTSDYEDLVADLDGS